MKNTETELKGVYYKTMNPIYKDLYKKPAYRLLIEELYKREMNLSDILQLLKLQNTTSGRDKVANMIMAISFSYPLYEPIPGTYKMLDEKDIEKYRRWKYAK